MKMQIVGATLVAAAMSYPAIGQTAAPDTKALEILCADNRLSAQEQDECRTQMRNAASEQERSKVIQNLNTKLSSKPPASGGPAGASSTGGTQRPPNE
ncbi:MAG: hypothetical protein AB7E79_13355 [Rhodospirillaceae bacterium]